MGTIYQGTLGAVMLSYTAPASLTSGIYFVRAATGAQTQVKKVVLLK